MFLLPSDSMLDCVARTCYINVLRFRSISNKSNVLFPELFKPWSGICSVSTYIPSMAAWLLFQANRFNCASMKAHIFFYLYCLRPMCRNVQDNWNVDTTSFSPVTFRIIKWSATDSAKSENEPLIMSTLGFYSCISRHNFPVAGFLLVLWTLILIFFFNF